MNLNHGTTNPLLVFAFAFVFALAGSACGKQACFFWTEAEGACPSQDEAPAFFGDPSCSPIESVDSEPEFDGELCCYDITERNAGEVLCGSGTTGAGGFGSTGTVGSGPVSSTGAGGSCQTCSSFANAAFMGTQPTGLCPTSQTIFNTLTMCLCSGPCQMVCSNDLVCMGPNSTTLCFDCATDSTVGCGNQFSTCVNDV